MLLDVLSLLHTKKHIYLDVYMQIIVTKHTCIFDIDLT